MTVLSGVTTSRETNVRLRVMLCGLPVARGGCTPQGGGTLEAMGTRMDPLHMKPDCV